MKSLANVFRLGVLLISLAGLLPTTAAESGPVAIARLTARGDIQRQAPPAAGKEWMPLYQGNGSRR